jgi:hypothetical protein
MQPKWIALGLFVAGLCFILGAGIAQLKHVAIGLASSLLSTGTGNSQAPAADLS